MNKKSMIGMGLGVWLVATGTAFGQGLDESEGGKAKEKTVEVTGQSAIFNNNTPAAKDAAIEQALRTAVEQTVGTFVSSESRVENFQLLDDRIYTKSRGYIRKYDVLSESPDGNVLSVKIRAVVAVGKLKGDLDSLTALWARKGKPKFMLLIVEQNLITNTVVYWWYGGARGVHSASVDMNITENTLIDKMSEKGFPFVDHRVLGGKLKIPKAFRMERVDDDAAAKIAKLTDAQIVIVGKALARSGGTVPGSEGQMKSAQALISARVVNTDDGKVLGAVTENAAAVHIDPAVAGTEALKKAAEAAAEKLGEKIGDAWQKETTTSATILLKATGVSDYKLVTGLVALLGTLRGVKSVNERLTENETSTIDVSSTTPASGLAAELADKAIEGKKVKVTGTTTNSITVKFE
ncbi:MAG: flagellar assembly protein T N-terminal domain-containing protein [Deltaproteobacteria bacterium]|nr:flagellar assembly protein T N-terminal domain-containing protein [Deltaproteobacteria bacterium]